MEGFDSTKGGFNGTILPEGSGGCGGTSFEDLGYSPFSTEETYAAGDVVIYGGSLYKFTASHSGAWTGTDAMATSVEELMKEKADAIKVLTREAQNLTDAEKAQVLANIGAIGEDDTLMTINGTGVKKGDAVTTAETAIVVDGAMSDSSQNPIQNKVVKAYVDGAIGNVIISEFVTYPGKKIGGDGTLGTGASAGAVVNEYLIEPDKQY
ncbi:MAG: hypothetical protein KBT57_01315, partial [bacterium]|nr:hypothetical protein [Candidatus Limimorpha equi]